MKVDQGPRVERQRATDEQSAHLRALIECSPDLIWSVDLEYRLVTFNQAFAKVVYDHYGVVAKPGMKPGDLAPARISDAWPAFYERTLAQGPINSEYSIGDGRWTELSFNPITIDGRYTGVSVFGKDVTERKQAEEKVKVSETRFRTLIDNAPLAAGISRNGITLYINRRYRELFRIEDESRVAGRPIGEFWAPGWSQQIEEWSRRRMHGDSAPTEYEALAIREDGSQFPVHVAVTLVELPDGPAVLAFLSDLTAHRKAEKALLASEERFLSYFDLPLVGMVTTSPQKGFLELNDRACEILGYSREELVETTWFNLTHPDDRAENVVLWDEMLSGKIDRFTLNKRFLRKDGSIVWTAISVGCVRTATGEVDYVCTILEDISERKAAEEAIRKAEQEYRQIFEQAPEGIFKTLPGGKALSLNPSGARMLGYETSEEAINSINDLANDVWMNPADRAAYITELELRGEVSALPCLFKRKDGSPIWVSMTVRRVKDDAGVPYHFQGYFENLSEKMRLEAELSEHLREVKLLSEMSGALLRARSEKELLEDYCRIIVETGGYRMAWVGFAESEPFKRVVPMAWAGHEDGYLSEIEIRWDGGEWSKGPTGRSILSGQIEVAQDYGADPRLAEFQSFAARRGYKSSIAVPFRLATDKMACLTAYGASSNRWSDSERRLMDQVAAALGFGINTLRTALTKDQYQKDLRASLEQTIQVIAGTVDQRDPYTAGHQRRVADLCTQIARKMGLNEDRVHGLHLAASIHDLGKLGIPAEILSKPGKLTAIQYSLVKEHAQLGYEIIRGVQFPWPIADMVWQHHERMDGSGYPNGLKADAILLESRILAVADVVEVMATHRPYRASLGIDAALQEIANGRGSLFDPESVDACIRVFREDGYELPSQLL